MSSFHTREVVGRGEITELYLFIIVFIHHVALITLLR